jgi:soluble lytic murein transglycosylase-like protein
MKKHETEEAVTAGRAGRPFVRFVFAGLAGAVALILVYAFGVPDHRAQAYFSSHDRSLANDVEAARRDAVVRWMGKNSAMPEQVLSKIYTVAAGTANPDLVLAVCVVESNFNPRAQSEKGALGLMGIMPGVWMEELRQKGIVAKKEDLYTIPGNVAAGAYVLEQYLAGSDSIRDALIRYEGGDSWYATRVLAAMRKISLSRSSQENTYLAALEH